MSPLMSTLRLSKHQFIGMRSAMQGVYCGGASADLLLHRTRLKTFVDRFVFELEDVSFAHWL